MIPDRVLFRWFAADPTHRATHLVVVHDDEHDEDFPVFTRSAQAAVQAAAVYGSDGWHHIEGTYALPVAA